MLGEGRCERINVLLSGSRGCEHRRSTSVSSFFKNSSWAVPITFQAEAPNLEIAIVPGWSQTGETRLENNGGSERD